MANLTRHKLPVWVWFRRQRSGLGDVTVTTFRFGCGYGDNVPVWVRLRRRRSGLGAVTVTTFRFGCGCGDNVPRLDVHTAYFRLAVRPVQRGDIRAARREEGRVEQKVKSSEMCPRTNHSSSRENTSKSINTKNHNRTESLKKIQTHIKLAEERVRTASKIYHTLKENTIHKMSSIRTSIRRAQVSNPLLP